MLSALLFAAAAPDADRVNEIALKVYAANDLPCEHAEPDLACWLPIYIDKRRTKGWTDGEAIWLDPRGLTDDQVAFVIAHELGHIVEPQDGKAKARELAADRFAAGVVTRAGYDKSAALGLFRSMELARVMSWPLSRHPSARQRAEAINAVP